VIDWTFSQPSARILIRCNTNNKYVFMDPYCRHLPQLDNPNDHSYHNKNSATTRPPDATQYTSHYKSAAIFGKHQLTLFPLLVLPHRSLSHASSYRFITALMKSCERCREKAKSNVQMHQVSVDTTYLKYLSLTSSARRHYPFTLSAGIWAQQ
jgi:hypothetical protein